MPSHHKRNLNRKYRVKPELTHPTEPCLSIDYTLVVTKDNSLSPIFIVEGKWCIVTWARPVIFSWLVSGPDRKERERATSPSGRTERKVLRVRQSIHSRRASLGEERTRVLIGAPNIYTIPAVWFRVRLGLRKSFEINLVPGGARLVLSFRSNISCGDVIRLPQNCCCMEWKTNLFI